jgi:hypothetical protein
VNQAADSNGVFSLRHGRVYGKYEIFMTGINLLLYKRDRSAGLPLSILSRRDPKAATWHDELSSARSLDFAMIAE